MKVSELASKIAKAEGLKKQVSIGNVREVIALICDEIAKDSTVLIVLAQNGLKRSKRKHVKK